MAVVGYARVSSRGQSLEVQLQKLKDAGCDVDRIYSEKLSGVDADRPQLRAALDFLRDGDTFIFTRIDRLARSVVDLSRIVDQLTKKGVRVKCVDQSIDNTTPEGRAMISMLATFAQFENEIRAERQLDGIAKARADGVKFGRKAKLTDGVVAKVKAMKDEGQSIAAIMEATCLKRATVYKALKQAEQTLEAAE
jgi:DNA invertase Pin-like site-specific DNA recombinase